MTPQPQPQAQGAQGAPAMPQELAPDQVRQMQVMVKQAMGLLLEDQTAEAIIQRCEAGDPKQVIASVVTGVMGQLFAAAQQAGQDIGMVTLMVTGVQIIGTLSEMLGAAGVVPQEALPQFTAEVSKMAIDQHNASLQQGQAPGGGQPPAAQPPAGGGMMMGGAA